MRKALYILGELDDRDIIFLTQAGTVLRLAPGETLIEAGRMVDHLYFVTDGALDVHNRAGRQLARLELGEVVGEMSFVEKRPPDATVVAATAARVLAVPRDKMLAEFERDAAMAARFYRALAIFLSDRLRTSNADGASEIDETILDTVQQAGERFTRLVAMLERSGGHRQ